MLALERLAEQRIEEALARGDFENLPGAGRPLDLDDDALVPEDLRVVFRVLKNAGFVPPEVEARRTLADLERILTQGPEDDAQARARAVRKLALLRTRVEREYYERVVRRLGGA